MPLRDDIKRMEDQVKRIEGHLSQVNHVVPFVRGIAQQDAREEYKKLQKAKKDLESLKPKPMSGYEEKKFLEETQKMGEILKENMLSKDEMMGENKGRTSSDGHAHDIRVARPQDVRRNTEFLKKFGSMKNEYDKQVEKFNYLKGEDVLKTSEELRVGRKI